MHDSPVAHHNTTHITRRGPRKLNIGQIGHLQRRRIVLLLWMETTELIRLPPLYSSWPTEFLCCDIALEVLQVVLSCQGQMCLG